MPSHFAGCCRSSCSQHIQTVECNASFAFSMQLSSSQLRRSDICFVAVQVSDLGATAVAVFALPCAAPFEMLLPEYYGSDGSGCHF